MTRPPSRPVRRWARHVALVLVVGALVWVAVKQRYGSPLAPGETAPPLAVDLSDGSRLDLAEPLGEVVVLNFWASWCAPCRAEAPELTRVHRDLTARGVGRVVGAAVETASPEQVQAHARGFGMRFPVAPVTSRWADAFGVQVLPTTVVLRADGAVHHTFVGAVRAKEVLAVIPGGHE